MHTHNNKYIFFITLLLLIFNHIPSTYSAQCIEAPLFDNKRYIKNCPQVNEAPNKLTKALSLENGDSSMIQILFTCDQVNKPELCKKAKTAFENVAKIIENTFDLKVPLVVNASFVKLCGAFVRCLDGQPSPLGAAGPYRYIPLKDDDGKVRLHSQALVKQLQLGSHPEFAPVDIIAGFNSESSVFWFRGDPEIGKEQVDFELVLTHEMLHGLGFMLSWDDYLNSDPIALTPFPSFIYQIPENQVKTNGTITFTGFQEYALDKYLVSTKDNSPLTLVTDQINQFTNLSTVFTDVKEFTDAFSKSPQFSLSKEIFKNSITRGSSALKLPNDGENVLMETGLVPYQQSSTFSHVDFNAFGNTTDFIMRFKAPRQVTLDDLTSINGNDPDYTNPIGPKTIRVFKALGYSMKSNPGSFKISSTQPNQNSTVQPQIPPNNIKDNSENTASSTFNTNTITALLSSIIISILLF